jgi:hemerythrin-like domain-containing protein
MPRIAPESPAVVETKLIHDVHRHATALLADVIVSSTAPVTAVRELRDFVVALLEHHHQSEDRDLWPTLTTAAPDLARPLSMLSAEHAELDRALHGLADDPLSTSGTGHARDAAVLVRDLVHTHLDHEEPVLFPALRAHVDDDAWAAFSRRTVETAPRTGISLLVSLLYRLGTEPEYALIFRHLPPEAAAVLPVQREQGDATIASLEQEVVRR